MPFKKALQFKYIEEKTLNFSGNNKILVNIKQKRDILLMLSIQFGMAVKLKKKQLLTAFGKPV